jgi:hypothetical protein
MSPKRKKRVALDVITNNKSITNLADENNTSRKYIRQQGKWAWIFRFTPFFLNQKPIVRSARMERKGKTPAEILSGKPHPHWLELLGFEHLKRVA